MKTKIADAVAFVILGNLLLLLTSAAPIQASQPNSIFIFSDEWGDGDLGLFGSSIVQTPPVDPFTAEGQAVDPLLDDPTKGDFRTKRDSPVRKLGNPGFDLSKVGLSQANDTRYPEFSWDKVPIAFHFGKSQGLLTKKEAKFVASRSNFICLEKGHASQSHGSTEAGIEAEARQLKRLNPKMKVIFYWNTFLDYSMFGAHKEYAKHPEWWLKTQAGELDRKNGRLMRYDLSNSEVRDWWTDVAAKAVLNGSCDGVFMDAFPQITNQANRKLWGDKKFEAIQLGLQDIIQETRQKLGSDNLIVYNGIRSTPQWSAGFDFPKHTDAAMIEHFGYFQSSSKEMMLQDILEMQRAAKAGKIVVLKGWAGFTFIDRQAMEKPLEEKRKIAKANVTFPLACFLAGAQENCYFIYNWGYRMENGCLEWYPEFDKPLGEPLGEMTRDGWKLSREYKHASVWVDLETKNAKISWR